MARSAKRLINGSQLTAVAATYYTTPVNTVTTVSAMTMTNTTGINRTVTVHLVPSGDSATAANMILSAYVLAAGASEPVTSAIGQTLAAGGTIQALSDLAAAVTLVASGYEQT